VAVPEFPPEEALIVTVPLAGGVIGAVYSPQVAPFVMNPGLPELPFKFACQIVAAHPAAVVNCRVAPAGTATAAGVTATGCDATTLMVIGGLAFEPDHSLDRIGLWRSRSREYAASGDGTCAAEHRPRGGSDGRPRIRRKLRDRQLAAIRRFWNGRRSRINHQAADYRLAASASAAIRAACREK